MAETSAFKTDNMVIITSKMRINMFEWRSYLFDNWDQLMKPNTRLLVLGGVHGTKKGRVSKKKDQALLMETQGQVKAIHDLKGELLEKNNITVNFENVGSHMEDGALDKNKLTKAVREHKPTILILAFCWTSQNELNDVFRAAGIYSVLIMQQDRAEVTQGKWIFLDERQREVVRRIADENARHVFLYGSHGTGKTIMLMEALRMKLAKYREEGRRVDSVIVTSYYDNCDKLMNLLESNYKFGEDVEVRYVPGFYNVRKEFDIAEMTDEEVRKLGMVSTMSLFTVDKLAAKLDQMATEKGGKVILVADELILYGHNKEAPDWRDVTKSVGDGVDLLLAMSPLSHDSDKGTFKPHDLSMVLPPKGDDVVSCQLVQRHRNCLKIQKLLRFLYTHSNGTMGMARGHFSGYDILLSSVDEIKEEVLPPSNLPTVWVRLKSGTFTSIVLGHIKLNYVGDDDSVTVIYDNDSDEREEDVGDVAEFCEHYKWGLVKG